MGQKEPNPAVTNVTDAPHHDVGTEAAGIIRGDRAKFYGPPWENIGAIAQAWGAYLKKDISAFDVCQLMVILKAIRGAQGYHRDSTVDTIGYALLAEVLEDPDARREFARDILGLYEATP